MAGHHADDLDAILDSALDDFESLNLSSSRSGDGAEFKQEAMPLPSGIQGLGMGLPDLRGKRQKGKQKAPQDMAHVAETLDQLRQHTREAVEGLESVTGRDDLASNSMIEDWAKQFEELAGSQDMESMMENMMQQLLSKEILYEPMKEIGEKYPKWLEDHKSTLSGEEFKRYSHQYELIKDLSEVYENEPENFDKIVNLMQKMQECGQPPSDIVRELTPDVSNFGQLSPEMLGSQPNCCVM